MTDEIKWGAYIEASNSREPLPWLKSDEYVFCIWGEGNEGGPYEVHHVHGWGDGFRIRLPDDHPYYLATSKGFTYWSGGDEHPADYDRGDILFRNGLPYPYHEGHGWMNMGDSWNIIGYKKRVDPPSNSQDIVRVLRVIEYVGPRADVEAQIKGSLHGERNGRGGCIIKAATVGTFPEILNGSENQ